MTPITSDEQALAVSAREWLDSDEGRMASSLLFPIIERQALRNRLEVAYLAGQASTRLAKTGPAVDGWLPIETAPRDGTPILAFNPMVGVYSTAAVEVGGFTEYPSGFWPDGKKNKHALGRWYCVPTHWRPLPEPPTAALEARG